MFQYLEIYVLTLNEFATDLLVTKAATRKVNKYEQNIKQFKHLSNCALSFKSNATDWVMGTFIAHFYRHKPDNSHSNNNFGCGYLTSI